MISPIYFNLSILLLLAGQALSVPMHNPTSPYMALLRPPERRDLEVFGVSEDIAGAATEIACCSFKFTPTTFPDGTSAVQVVKTCVLVDSANGSCPTGSVPDDGSTGSGTVTSQPASIPGSVSPTSTPTSLQTSTAPLTGVTSSTEIPLSLTSILLTTTAEPTSTPTSSKDSSSSPQSSSAAFSNSNPNPATTLTFLPDTTPTPSSTIGSPTGLSTTNSNTSSSPSSSSALPKIIGAFAGASVLFLIIGATIGYLKRKKMPKESEPILWPETRQW
ncbi:hypothetical protein M422DRAFT_776562 [Sphaerobolus stellatus SS14]|nr:hypothetical protein M422DRAFT_776562 [Sphaerobolus stellatus SS14]